MERRRTRELTDDGGVRGDDEEDGDEKPGDKHGDDLVGFQLGGWCPRTKPVLGFISALISCEREKSGVGSTPYSIRLPVRLASRRASKIV